MMTSSLESAHSTALDLLYPMSPQPAKGLKLLGTVVLTLRRPPECEMEEMAEKQSEGKEEPSVVAPSTTSSGGVPDTTSTSISPLGVRIVAYGGSVMEFVGGCIVNAANTGGVTGFGIDEMVNKAAGHELLEFRRGFGGIPTGEAKISPSFKHKKVRAIVHATGPHYHRDLPGMPKMTYAVKSHEENDVLLASAYKNALRRAAEGNLGSMGYCLLSAGVFKGPRSLDQVIRVGLEAIKQEVLEMMMKMTTMTRKDESNGECIGLPIREVALFAFMPEEQKVLASEFASVFNLAPPAADTVKTRSSGISRK